MDRFCDKLGDLEEFREFLSEVAVTQRCPLPTEMYFLWSMIRWMRPTLFIESGTFRAFSSTFICDALERNSNGAEFVSFGFDLDDCLKQARQRLSRYPFAQVVEGDSRPRLARWPLERRPTAFFIDGPKGRNMPPLLYAILKRFKNPLFIAVHDCERESGSGNRWYLETFFAPEREIVFCGAEFQESLSFLDEGLIGHPAVADWKPHWRGGKPMVSYGTETGYVLFGDKRQGSVCVRLKGHLRRFVRFRVLLPASNRLREVKGSRMERLRRRAK